MRKRNKRALKMLTTLVLTMVMILITVSPAIAQATKKLPTLNSTNETILMGKTFVFGIKNDKKGSTYSWVSSNEKIATVDEKGSVLGVNKGKVSITCIITTSESKKYRVRANVLVIKPAVKVKITNKITNITAGESYNLNTTIIPASSTDAVVWTTSDKSIADPTDNGVFKAYKEGTVTLTAKALSGRSDSVTIEVLASGDEYVEVTPEPIDTKDNSEDTVATTSEVFSEDFSKSVGSFTARGAASIEQTNETGADGNKGYLSVTNRTASWHGTSVDVTSLVKPGKSYTVSGWVKYTEGNDTEVFKITQQKNGSSWPAISGDVTVEKNKWTKLTGTLIVDADTTACEVYFETSTNATISFLCDDLVIMP